MIGSLAIWYFGMGMMVAGFHFGVSTKDDSEVKFFRFVLFGVIGALTWPGYLACARRSEVDR